MQLANMELFSSQRRKGGVFELEVMQIFGLEFPHPHSKTALTMPDETLR